MNIERAIEALDAIDGSDPESAHYQADCILQALTDGAVDDAMDRLKERCRWWAWA